MHICVGKLVIIGSDNGLSTGRRQAIIWTNGGILLITPLRTNVSEILIGIHTFSFKKIYLQMSSAKWRPFCLGLNGLKTKKHRTCASLGHKICMQHGDFIKWNHFPRHWPFVRGIHQSSVNSHQKGPWRRALMLSLTCAWINGWINNREAGDLRRHRAHYDVTMMVSQCFLLSISRSLEKNYQFTNSLHYPII